MIETAKLIEGGVLINGNTTLPDGNTGHIRNMYDRWLAEGNTPEPMDVVVEPSFNDKQLSLRKLAYDSESDPLYTEWKFDQIPELEQVWRDKVLEIKGRYPLED